MSETGVQIVFSTFPDTETARQIGTALVERQLARCVNLIPSVESIYLWEGELNRSGEVLAMFKVARSGFAAFEAALVEAHPYDVPEVVAVDVAAGHAPFLRWVSGS